MEPAGKMPPVGGGGCQMYVTKMFRIKKKKCKKLKLGKWLRMKKNVPMGKF